jgi:regulatory protein
MSPKAKALQYLAQRDHSRQELRSKLLRWAARSEAAARGPGNLAWTRADTDSQATAGDDTAAAAAAVALHASVDAVLDALTEQGLLSDARFAQSRVHARQARFGNRRISTELRQHGVTLDTEQMAALRDSELERAQRVLAAKFASQPSTLAPLTADELQRMLARQQRFLAARGFSSETIRQALKRMRASDPG